jgi:hypothetical protein
MSKPSSDKIARESGVVAEFATPEEAARAARFVRDQGFRNLEAYGPFPSEELAEAIDFHEHRVAPCVLAGGIVGGLSGFALQYYATVTDYPHNVGGRPLFSWPSFIPVTFECTVLFACVTGLVTLLILNRLPRLAHPIFSAAHFERATTDRFFLCITAAGFDFSFDRATKALESCSPVSISIVTGEELP